MSTSKSPNAREIYELKQQAVRYYEENGVPQKFEEILNSMFYENPSDVYGHLVSYFEQYSKPPVISKLKAREVFDSHGQTTLQTDIHCTVCNSEKVLYSETCGTFCQVPEYASSEDKDAEEKMRLEDVLAAIDLIHGPITDSLTGIEPTNQEEADSAVYGLLEKLRIEAEENAKEAAGEENNPEDASPTPGRAPAAMSPKGKVKSAGKTKTVGKGPAVAVVPDEPLEKFHPGSNAVASVSVAVCQAGAVSAKKPLYQHVAQLMNGQVANEYRLPLPMVTILSSGRVALGKTKCVKDYMVIPRPGMPAKESLKHIAGISNALGKTCSRAGGSAKGKKGGEGADLKGLMAGPKLTSELGVVMPLIERPEQGIEMIQDAMTVLGLTPGEDFHIALNCAAHETFDFEKGKYEPVVGVQKDPEGMVDFWADIVTRYPAVIALIDPLRKQDADCWMQLCERISEQCYVMGDAVYHRPGLLKNEELTPAFKTSAILLRVEQMNTVSDVMIAAKKMQDADNQIVIGTSQGETNSSLVVDLACGMNARFLMVGGMSRGERITKLNRLLQIESELGEIEGHLRVWEEHAFTLIKPPTPPPEEPENPEEGAEQ